MKSSMSRLPVYALLFTVSLSSLAYGANSSTVVQNGSSDTINVTQTGNNISNTTINGDGSSFDVTQTGEGNVFGGQAVGSSATIGSSDHVTVAQTGIKNVVSLTNFAGITDTASFLQNGHDNYLDLTSNGSKNAFDFTQYGGGNSAFSEVAGDSNSVTYKQYSPDGSAIGAGNVIGGSSGTFTPNDHIIMGSANSVSITQVGGNVTLYHVAGNANKAVVTQDAGITSTQANKNSAEFNILGSSDDVLISQTGLSNTAKINSTGSSDVAHITQSGASNFAQIAQTNGDGNSAIIAQTGNGNTATVTQTGAGNKANVIQK